MKSIYMECSAGISDDEKYRYWLKRVWNKSLPQCTWIMLNPSVADSEQDDPTIRRCMSFARNWGCGSIHVVNLFAYRATKPDDLREVDDPVGPENDYWIESQISLDCGPIIAAWGSYTIIANREREVREMLVGSKVECLGLSASGKFPRHPLYVEGKTQPIPFPLGV